MLRRVQLLKHMLYDKTYRNTYEDIMKIYHLCVVVWYFHYLQKAVCTTLYVKYLISYQYYHVPFYLFL